MIHTDLAARRNTILVASATDSVAWKALSAGEDAMTALMTLHPGQSHQEDLGHAIRMHCR